MSFGIKYMYVACLSLGLIHACGNAMTGDQISPSVSVHKVPDAQQSIKDTACTDEVSALLDCIHAAKDRICIAVYQLKAMEIARALASAHARGVKIWVVCDHCSKDERAVRFLVRRGIKVFIWNEDNPSALMLHEDALIDEDIVWDDSFNWIRNENDNNHERVIVTKNKKKYDDFFDEFADKLLPSSQWLFAVQNSQQ
jgi:hypothetical protein